jgi:hypothetical protein
MTKFEVISGLFSLVELTLLILWFMKVAQIVKQDRTPRGFEVKLTGGMPVLEKKEVDHG